MMKAAPSVSYLNNPIPWTFSFEMFFLFEIDVSAIEVPMPRGLFPLEVRPGVGLIGIGNYFAGAGNLGYLPSIVELDWTVAVQPDLSRSMPTPRFGFIVGNIASTCKPFLDHAHNIDKMPVYHSPTMVSRFDTDNFSAEFEDEQGPIVSMKSTHKMAPTFIEKTIWGQQSSIQGEEWFQAWSWKGTIFEHQQGHRAAKVHKHPLFKGINVEGLGDRCYLQIITRPHTPIEVTFYEPTPFAKKTR